LQEQETSVETLVTAVAKNRISLELSSFLFCTFFTNDSHLVMNFLYRISRD